MNYFNTFNSILHRPSRSINRVATSAANSRADVRNQATAVPSSPSVSNLTLRPSPSSLFVPASFPSTSSRTTTGMVAPSISEQPATYSKEADPVIKPNKAVNIGAFNVRTLMQIGQLSALARTLDTLKIDVCCVSETRIQDSSQKIKLTAPGLTKPYWLYTSGDEQSIAVGRAGVGVALSSNAISSLLDWIPINSRLCAVRLATSVKTATRRHTRRNVLFISTYAPTDCSDASIKDEFYAELTALIRSARSSDIVILAGDMNAQVGQLSDTESHLGGKFSLSGRRSDNGDRLLHLCAESKLFLASTNFRNRGCRLATWRNPSSLHKWSQIDHVAISYRWRGSIEDCRSYWNTCLDSDHALIRFRFKLTFSGKRTHQTPRLAVGKLSQPEIKRTYQNMLAQKLDLGAPSNLNECWSHISSALEDTGRQICGTNVSKNDKHWISAASLELLDSRRRIPAGNTYNNLRRNIRKQLKRSLQADREMWLANTATEMEVAHRSGNTRRLFQLVKSLGPKQKTVSETIEEADGTLIQSQTRRMDRWAEYFEAQFSWPATAEPISVQNELPTWDVNVDPPTVEEVSECLMKLRRFKAGGPDNLPPALFKDGGDALAVSLTLLFTEVWKTEDVPANWGESVIVPIFKKGSRRSCDNHRGISLTPVVTRVLASLVLGRLMKAREANIREEQAGFRPGRGCIDHIFTLRQVLEQRHVYRRPTIAVFLDYKGAFDSVERLALINALTRRGVPAKYVNIIRSMYINTSGRVRVYGATSKEFSTTSGVRQGCPLSPFLFNFVIDEIMEDCLQNVPDYGLEMVPGRKLTDLAYADDKVLLFEDFHIAQAVLERITLSARTFGMRFAPTKCKVIAQDCLDCVPLSLDGHELAFVDHFVYLGSSISSDGSMDKEIDSRIAKARSVFADLRHLWRQKGVSMHLKGRVYSTTVRAVLLYGSETWPLRVGDTRRLEAFDHRCIRSIVKVKWYNHISNDRVRQILLGSSSLTSLSHVIRLNKLRWLGHVLRMPNHRLPIRAIKIEPESYWRKARGGQRLTWIQEMKTLSGKLGKVGNTRLPGWGPRDSSIAWLETVGDMARDRNQWRECCRFLAEPHSK